MATALRGFMFQTSRMTMCRSGVLNTSLRASRASRSPRKSHNAGVPMGVHMMTKRDEGGRFSDPTKREELISGRVWLLGASRPVKYTVSEGRLWVQRCRWSGFCAHNWRGGAVYLGWLRRDGEEQLAGWVCLGSCSRFSR